MFHHHGATGKTISDFLDIRRLCKNKVAILRVPKPDNNHKSWTTQLLKHQSWYLSCDYLKFFQSFFQVNLIWFQDPALNGPWSSLLLIRSWYTIIPFPSINRKHSKTQFHCQLYPVQNEERSNISDLSNDYTGSAHCLWHFHHNSLCLSASTHFHGTFTNEFLS